MDKPKLELIYRKYKDVIFRFALSLTYSEDQAFDIVQETFIRAYKYHNKEIENEKSWLLKIAFNVFRAQKNEEKKIEQSRKELIKNREKLSTYVENTDWYIIREEILNKLREKNKKLVDIFLLRLDHNRNLQDIGKILNISHSTVRRSMEKIRALIMQNFRSEFEYLFNKKDTLGEKKINK